MFPFLRSLIRDGKTAQVTALETELKSLKCKLEEKDGVNEIQTAQISSLLGENTQIGEENQRKLSEAIELQTQHSVVIDKLKTEVQAKEENAARLNVLQEQLISLVNEHKKTVDEKEERISSHISLFTALQAKHTTLMDREAQDKTIKVDELRQAHAQLSEWRQQHILLTDAHRNASAHVIELQSQLASLMDNHSQLQVEEQQKIQVLTDQLKDTTHQYEKVGANLTITEGDMRTTAAALKAMTAEKQDVVVQWEKCQMMNRKTSQELSCVQDEHESAKTLLEETRVQLQQMTAERQDVGSLLEVTKIQHATTNSELGKTSSELAKTHVELHKTKSDLKALGDEHTRVKTFLEENKLQIQQMSAERQDVGSQFDDTKAQHATTKSELGKTTLELEKTHADLLKTTSDLKALGHQHMSVEKLLDETKQQHVTTKSELHQTTLALVQMTAQLEDMKTQYEITKNLLSKAFMDLAEEQAAVQKFAAEYKGLQTHLAEVQLQFEKTSADLSGLQQRVGDLEAGEIVLKASVHDLTESKVQMCTEHSQKLAQKETELLERQQVIDMHIACVGELTHTISNRDLNLEQNASAYSSELQHRINELKEKQQVIDSQAVCIVERDADLELLAAELQAKDCALQNKDSESQHLRQVAESQASRLEATIKENVKAIALRDTTIEENTTQLQERQDSIETHVTLFECALAAKEEEIVRLTTALEDTAMHLQTAASDLASARFVASVLLRAIVHCCCFLCLLLLLLLVLPVCYILFLFPNSSTGRAKTVSLQCKPYYY